MRSSSIGFTAVKITDCLSPLRLLPPGINALLILNAFHLLFRCGWCTRWSPSATVHGLATQDQRDYLLNVLELLWKNRKCLEELGFKQYWNIFFGLPPFARKDIQSLIGLCEVPSNFSLNSSMMSSNRTAPSSSRRIAWSCRSNLIMDFDTAKQSWQNLSGLMSIHVLSRRGIEMGDSVTASFSRGFAFCNKFPCNSVLNAFKRYGFWRFGYVFINSIHNSNPRNWSVSKQRFDQDFNTVTLHVQKKPIFVFPIIHPLGWDCGSLRRDVHSRHEFFIPWPLHPRLGQFSCFRESALSLGMLLHFEAMCTLDKILHFIWSFFFIKCVEELSFFQQSSNQRRSKIWIISGLQEGFRIYAHNLAAGFRATLRRCEDQQ